MASASAAAFGGGGLTIQQDENEGQADLKRLSGCAMFKQLVLCTVCVALMALGCALVCVLPASTLSFRNFPGGGVCFALLPAEVKKWHCGAGVEREESGLWRFTDAGRAVADRLFAEHAEALKPSSRGIFGETVLHQCLIFTTSHTGGLAAATRLIVEEHPELINLAYTHYLYFGEVAAHICMVRARWRPPSPLAFLFRSTPRPASTAA